MSIEPGRVCRQNPDQWFVEDGSLYRAGGWTQGRYRVTAAWVMVLDVPPDDRAADA